LKLSEIFNDFLKTLKNTPSIKPIQNSNPARANNKREQVSKFRSSLITAVIMI